MKSVSRLDGVEGCSERERERERDGGIGRKTVRFLKDLIS
mgnify:CR=1 FL=1